jgi:hypothetical protein
VLNLESQHEQVIMDILTVEDEEEEEATKLYGGNDV